MNFILIKGLKFIILVENQKHKYLSHCSQNIFFSCILDAL